MSTTIDSNGIASVITGWTAEKYYHITYSTVNRLISGIYGSVAPFTEVEHYDANMSSYDVGQITKEVYDSIAESILNPSQLSFLMVDNSIKVRKIMIDFGPNTYLDGKRNAIVGVDNLITIIPKCVDQHGNLWNDVTEIQLKNMEKKEFDMNINGQESSQYKGNGVNGQPVTFKLNETGRATIRVKATIPELDFIWVSLYPELYGYDDVGQAKLAAWVAEQPK